MRRDIPANETASTGGPLNVHFDRLVKKTMDDWKVPGLSIAVVEGDNIWAKGYGVAALPDRPVTPSTLFFTGSTTKAFTAAALAMLVDDARFPQLQWDTPVNQLLREDFVLADDYATNHITLEDILSHRSGLPRHDQSYGHDDKATVKDIVQSLRHLPLTAEPRTKFQYCNLMFVVASHVIESVTGQWLGDFLAERIWHPLGMEGTFFRTEDAKTSRYDLARGYSHDGTQYQEIEWMRLDEVSGAGSVISNVLDYAKWAHAFMTRSKPLSDAVYRELWSPRTLAPQTVPFTGPTAYALGWFSSVYRGHVLYQHGGAMNAFGAEFIIFPDLKYSLVVFANTAGSSNVVGKALLYHLVDEKLQTPLADRFNWIEQGRTTIHDGQMKARSARERFYPSLPSPVLPPSAPLGAYAGTYHHPGYQNLTVYLDESTSTLRADRTGTTWPEAMRFEHVSGEYFLAYAQHTGDFGAYFPEVYPVEFRLGTNGTPRAVGVRWEESMREEKIWLVRTT